MALLADRGTNITLNSLVFRHLKSQKTAPPNQTKAVQIATENPRAETNCCDFYLQSDKSHAIPNATMALGTLETALVTLY
ncbi:hypothetical protein [Aliiroseovarius lamellibrachiae]|uniref:hypothetical protein n=1 Tax=Aliiroseovarius lamellibrachiae TaxID=1924933 RepID=UPI001BE061FE|nr:hypothetical protein [Aliiroseovarius lamellibrachiae]